MRDRASDGRGEGSVVRRGRTRTQGLGVLRVDLHVFGAERPELRAAHDHGGPRLAAPGSPLQLRGPRDRFTLGRLQLERRQGAVAERDPMLGGVFGRTTGIAPGAEVTLDWWKLELYGEGEYVFDTDDSSGSFLYTWSELSLSPVHWFRIGGVIQRTEAYHTDVDLQRGFLVGLSYKRVALRGYVSNPDEDAPTTILAVGVVF